MSSANNKDFIFNQVEKFDYGIFKNFKFIGEGGFGKVERAYCKTLKKDVALKSIKNDIHESFTREVINAFLLFK